MIDGYLSQAQVCVDRNSNSSCDSGEVVGLTDSNGAITIKAEDAKYAVIAQAIAGQTADSDKAGKLGNSYELIAHAQSEVVTPFTTIAKLQNKTVEALATELNLDSAVVAGDYVAAKAQDGSADAAKKAHLMARSLTNELAPSLADNDSEALSESADDIANVIEDSINNGHELDDIVIEINDDGTVESKPIIASLNDYLEGQTLSFVSMNKYYAQDEGIFMITLQDGTLTVVDDTGASMTEAYTIEGNSLVHVEDGEESIEEFIYVSEQTSLAVTPQNDLNFWTRVDITDEEFKFPAITEAMIADQTWYFLSDDSTDHKPYPMLAAMAFSKDKNVVISEEGEEDFTIGWRIENSELILDFPEGDNDMYIKLVTKDSNTLTIVDGGEEQNKNHFSLLVKDKALAESIVDKWGDEI
ncbi:hypothetical protein NHN17_21860 [Photobacterium sp. ZSDE20]|uniref:Uncharacterized protein n=1 Tax=Photobacterium pectinilyticum TaxID=2906793 RepID=A0ABT1N7G8_9GAMM|nr:hypothetical protein [Photobacterium sp. ZSDE20]MCQ1060696.1 hypothetical protein [Photobacterium sp. ZSDE20]